ncbi:MAG: T9SS type A sorting domain-containing protein [Bacteroidetes bacterium]|nr:T9SS type A sorting domain-containing protein [Bacteroidota bacterium]MBS1630548.1 T9SS type A sorting domain-containing protein [Bacteroidota bacterium]
MLQIKRFKLLWLGMIFLLTCPLATWAQGEQVAPLGWNPALRNAKPATIHSTAKKSATTLSLPFFEDFSDYSPYPNGNRWQDSEVYINNTLCVAPVSRGVATFDALNALGRPYDTVNRYQSLYADSLTSQFIDLSGRQLSDSIYLSFFYQPQGNGFSPETGDSLMLFFYGKNGRWVLAWSVPGTDLQPFQQVMIPLTDTMLFFPGFQFRFINKASINSNDDVWNLDYIRMDAGRNMYDTAIRDLAFTTPPGNMLNDFTAMPYGQYLAQAATERNAAMSDSFQNHYSTPATVNFGFFATETSTGSPLGSGSNSATVTAYGGQIANFPVYSTTITPANNRARVVYQNTYYLQSGNPNEPHANDTAIQEQVFDNYLAYDDGSAEKSYFLNLASQLPGKTAIEFRLNTPDTLRGMAIYFGQQVPTAAQKYFSIVVYSKLGGIAGGTTDEVLYQKEFVLPVFSDTVNGFSIYRFDTTLVLPAGVFYLGTTQPAASGSDSLYIGLDVNRIGGNHLYYNVLNQWVSSSVSGALMIRPLLGGPVTGTSVPDAVVRKQGSIYPNPCTDRLFIPASAMAGTDRYRFLDMQGRTLQTAGLKQEGLDVAWLAPGIYLLQVRSNGLWQAPQKFIKR